MTVLYTSNRFSQLKLQGHVFRGSRSTRMLNYVGLLTMLGIALAVSYSVAYSYEQGEPLKDVSFLYEIPLFGFSFAQIFFGAALIGYVCSEWNSGFIYTTYGATQKSFNFILSKLFWPLAFALCAFTLTLLATVPLESVLVARGTPYSLALTDPTVWRQIAVANFNLASSILFAGGLALILRQTAAALGAYIAFSLIAPIVFGLIPLEIARAISQWLPNNLYGYLITQDPVMVENLNYPLLFIATAAYPIVAIGIGALLFKRRPV